MTSPAVTEIQSGTLDGFSLGQWRAVLHKALGAFRANPQDREAAQWAQRALLKINALNVGGNEADANAVHQTSPVASTAAGLLHGLSLGTGEVMSGVNTALQGKGFRQGAQSYRENLSDLEASHPTLSAGSEIAGSLALPAAKVGQTVAQGVKAGVPLGIRGALALMGRGGVSAGVPAAVSGFSAGGEDPADFGARVQEAGKQGAIGTALGAITAGAGIPFARRGAERAADLESRGVQRTRQTIGLEADRMRLENSRIRNELLKRRFAASRNLPEHVAAGPVDDIGQAIADYKAGRISEDDLNTALSFATQEPKPEVPADIPTQGPKEGAPARAASTVTHRTPDELDVATFKRRNTPIPGAEGGPIARKLGMRARPGHPVYSGEPAPTRSPEVRGGEPLLPSAQASDITPSVSTGAADAYLRAGNLSQLERFDPGELASRAKALRGIGPVQMARIVDYLSRKMGPEIPMQAAVSP